MNDGVNDGFANGVHRTPIVVRFGELDPYNHVNHAVYVAWCEAGRAQALADAGVALHDMAALGLQIVVTDLNVRFRKPALAGDRVTVETWISELGGVRSVWKQRVLRPTDDPEHPEVLVELEVRAGSTGTNGRPIRLPANVRGALVAHMVNDRPVDGSTATHDGSTPTHDGSTPTHD